eukprot:6991063-Pyramimonas_sp.AAC.1
MEPAWPVWVPYWPEWCGRLSARPHSSMRLGPNDDEAGGSCQAGKLSWVTCVVGAVRREELVASPVAIEDKT